jgi:metal-responsive CopG/Arc/MetJ family transcriptional regulator
MHTSLMNTRETRRAHVIVPEALLEEVDRVVGKRGRSSFFAEAASEKLRRIKLVEAAKKAAGTLKGAVSEWETPQMSDAYVRRLREESEERLARKRDA